MKCVILDDEPFAHQVLEHYIAQTPGLSLLAGFRNAVDAYEFLGKQKADVLFLDIEMPLINGIGFLKALPDPPKTIFTTAYKQYAFEGFELDAVDYLLKPFSYERFIKAVNKVSQPVKANEPVPQTLVIKDKEGLLNLKQADIFYIEGLKDYIKIVTVAKAYVVHHTLKGILQKLDANNFMQAHRSFIVNKTHINRIYEDHLILSNKTFVPIGQSYKKELLLKMGG